MFDRPSTRQELYDRIRASSKAEVVLEEMIRLGYWPAEGTIPEDPADEIRQRGELTRELATLHTEMARLQDENRLRRELKKRRLEESRAKRKATKERRVRERRERSYQWRLRQHSELTYLGEAVSGGLSAQASAEDSLKANGLPLMHSAADLAKETGLQVGHLRHLTFHRAVSTTTHYARFTIPKKSGGQRQISAPRPRLKWLQHWVLRNILEKVEPHEASHGFRAGRSIKSNASAHLGAHVVVNVDLRDFFPTITYPRVKGMFRALGYAEPVATVLALGCTEPEVMEVQLDGKTYYVHQGLRRLPQGAPSSPAITNILCRRLDRRVNALAKALGFTYTRYADDFTFSSTVAEPLVGKLLGRLSRVVHEEGFAIHSEKTRVFHRGRRQEVTGLVINAGRPTICRSVLRRFRATLFQIEKDGPAGKRWGRSKDVLSAIQGYASFIAMVEPDKGKAYLARVRAILTKHAASRNAPQATPAKTLDPVAERQKLFRPLPAPQPPPKPPPVEAPPVLGAPRQAAPTATPRSTQAARVVSGAGAPIQARGGVAAHAPASGRAAPGSTEDIWRTTGVVPPPTVGQRVGAKVVDLLVGAVTMVGFGFFAGSFTLGAVIGLVWLLYCDWSGSPGKYLFALRTVMAANGRPCGLIASIKRNMPLMGISFIWPLIEYGMGMTRAELTQAYPAAGRIVGMVVLAIWYFETRSIGTSPRGQRFGDRWAKTVVVRRLPPGV